MPRLRAQAASAPLTTPVNPASTCNPKLARKTGLASGVSKPNTSNVSIDRMPEG
jgi:hypothetical protein